MGPAGKVCPFQLSYWPCLNASSNGMTNQEPGIAGCSLDLDLD